MCRILAELPPALVACVSSLVGTQSIFLNMISTDQIDACTDSSEHQPSSLRLWAALVISRVPPCSWLCSLLLRYMMRMMWRSKSHVSCNDNKAMIRKSESVQLTELIWMITTTTTLQPLCMTTYVSWHPQLRTGGFCWNTFYCPHARAGGNCSAFRLGRTHRSSPWQC